MAFMIIIRKIAINTFLDIVIHYSHQEKKAIIITNHCLIIGTRYVAQFQLRFMS